MYLAAHFLFNHGILREREVVIHFWLWHSAAQQLHHSPPHVWPNNIHIMLDYRSVPEIFEQGYMRILEIQSFSNIGSSQKTGLRRNMPNTKPLWMLVTAQEQGRIRTRP